MNDRSIRVPVDVVVTVSTRADAASDVIRAERERFREIAERLLAVLRTTRRKHYTCDDNWYSCPKSGECGNEDKVDGPCDCGADAFNAEVDKAIAAVERALYGENI